MNKIDAATMVGLACRLGALQAIEFAEFAESLGELDDQQRKMLLRGWIAVESMPKDATLESSDLRKCLSALRMAWVANNQAARTIHNRKS